MTETDEQQALALRDSLIIEVQAIKTDADRVELTTARQNVKGWLDSFTAIEKAICDPVYKAWKNAKNRFAEGRAPAEKWLEAADRELRADRQRQLAAQAAEQKRQDDLAAKRRERAEAAGKVLPIPVAVAPIVQDTGRRIETEAGTATWVDNWVPRIVDESLIPREYLMPDMAKLKAAVKANIKVPGVERVNEPYMKGAGR
jgi:hypothetical protein